MIVQFMFEGSTISFIATAETEAEKKLLSVIHERRILEADVQVTRNAYGSIDEAQCILRAKN